MEKLKKIMSLCKCSVSIDINTHRDVYESVENHLKYYYNGGEDLDNDDVSEEILKEMIKRDTIVHIQCYPQTPIGFYYVYHYDLEMAIDEMLRILEK